MDQPSSTENNAIVLRIKFKSPSLDEFIGRYGADVSPGGIFIRTKQPVEVGTSLQFDFTLADGSPLLVGTGTVAWVRESDPARANNMPGMGLRFDKLSPESQHIHQMILAEKARKEGKALGTPQTALAPARTSPSSESLRPVVEEPPKPDANEEGFSAPITLASPTPAQVAQEQEANDFTSGGKTEISDKSIEERLREMSEAGSAPSPIPKTSERAIPSSLLDSATESAMESAIIDPGSVPVEMSEPTSGEAPGLAPVTSSSRASGRPTSGERRAAGFAALLDLGGPPPSPADAVPVETVPELSGGAPLEETESEKTEPVLAPMAEVSSVPAAPIAAAAAQVAPAPAPEPFDMGIIAAEPARSGAKAAVPSLKPKGMGKSLVAVAVLGAIVAFVAVYLAKTKPWEQPAQPQVQVPVQVPVVVAPPAPPPSPPPPTVNPAPAPAPAANPAPEPAKPAVVEKAAPVKSVEAKPADEKAASSGHEAASGKSTGKTGQKPSDKASAESVAVVEEDTYRLYFRSTPLGAEVLIDGEYFSRTPCDRRILDPKKPTAVLIRKEGFESYERMLGPSDEWTKKGHENSIRITARLTKAKVGAAEATPSAATATESASAAKPETAPAVKPESKQEPAKPAAAPATKSSIFKPVPNLDEPKKGKPAPNFDEAGKAKE
jgi:uncharacterized protein (TIGR02266 family)